MIDLIKESKTNEEAKITQDDKLLFELGEGFKKLSQETIDECEKIYDSLLEEKEEEYGYHGDSPYYDATKDYLFYLRYKFDNDEEFIQAVANHCDYSTFGWALSKLKDEKIFNYSRKYLYDILASDDVFEEDEDEINEYLDCETLPM